MGEIRLGTSGWSYREWEGAFYPKGEKKKLSYYSRFFRTVEIDSTFYAYPSQGMVLGALRSTPPDFVFSAKLPRLITHDKGLDLARGVKQDLLRFVHLLRPLIDAGKLGPLLVQLPPGFGYPAGIGPLGAFLDAVPPDLRFAVEFRNASWTGRSDAFELLRAHGAALTVVDEPLLPPEVARTADFAFLRWHGRGDRPWYNYRYRQGELEGWRGKLEDVASGAEQTYGYFNNHFRGFAVENALQMMDLMGSASPEQRGLLARVSRRIDASPTRAQATL